MTPFCRLSFEEMTQWSLSLERLLSSKCNLNYLLKTNVPPGLWVNAVFLFTFRRDKDLPGLPEVRVQRWEHWVLDGVWGLQEDQVFVQDVLQGQKDLQMLHPGWGHERGRTDVPRCKNLWFLTAIPPADQHWSQDQRPDQEEGGGAHPGLL